MSVSKSSAYFFWRNIMNGFSRLAVLLLFAGVLSGCNSSNQPSATTPAAAADGAKRYQLKGKVMSLDKRGHMVNVDSEAIPGLMPAMTMPYQVKADSELDKLSPGEAITADLVVQGDSSWIENIAVAGHDGKK